jgi:hypothetical protein
MVKRHERFYEGKEEKKEGKEKRIMKITASTRFTN